MDDLFYAIFFRILFFMLKYIRIFSLLIGIFKYAICKDIIPMDYLM